MSSNHTYVSMREWAELQQRVADTNAYVISRRAEAQRLRDEAERRSREIAAAREASRQAINGAIQSLHDAYQATVRDIGGAYASQAAARSADFEAQIRGMLAEVSNTARQINLADARVNDLARLYSEAFQQRLAQTQQGQARAEAFQAELEGFLTRMDALEPQRFLPGEYAALRSLWGAVSANLQAGDYGAATAVSQNGILQAARLTTQLTLLNEDYQRRLAEVRSAAAALRTRFDRFASQDGRISVEVAGERQEYEYDIAYWSHGAYDRLAQQLSVVEILLAEGRTTMEELEQARQTVAQLETQLDRCDESARRAMAGSIFVEDTAVRLHNSLTDRGWALAEGGHYGDEVRNPYTLRYEDGSGNTVSVVVSPGERVAEPCYAIEVFADDEYRAQLIKEGVHASVAGEGLQIEGIEYRDDCHLNPTPEQFTENMVREALRRQRQ